MTPCIAILNDIIATKRNMKVSVPKESIDNSDLIANEVNLEDKIENHIDVVHNNKGKWNKLKVVKFVWTCRDNFLFEEFWPLLEQAGNMFGHENILLFNTNQRPQQMIEVQSKANTAHAVEDRDEESSKHSQMLTINSKRPNIGDIIANTIKQPNGAGIKTAVFTCGPNPMIQEVNKVIDQYSYAAPNNAIIHNHSEVFEF